MPHATTDPEDARRAAALHARTALLLGVDFLPAYGAAAARPASAGALEQIEAKPAPAAEAPTPREPRRERDTPPEPEAAATRAAADASAPTDDPGAALDELRARYEADAPHAGFDTDFTNIVFGEGDPRARLMFVGEAPGAEEDKTGRPFVGRAGQLLDKMIVAMGLRREDVYIANVLKTRPPNNRTPTIEEARACAPYLYEQIGIVSPEAIVTLGAPATRLLLETDEGIGKLRGRWAEFPPAGTLTPTEGVPLVPVMPTYHPAFLLRSYTPENRKKVWSDLQQVIERLGLAPASPPASAG